MAEIPESGGPVIRVGIGYDAHRLVTGRDLVLGGVHIPYSRGLLGHSDADVFTHALIDGILGGMGLGDIGTHFPDDDPNYKDISSLELLDKTMELVKRTGGDVQWVDGVIVAQRPRLASHIFAIKTTLADCMGISADWINVKAKTTEGMGFEGRGEGISAQVVVTLRLTG